MTDYPEPTDVELHQRHVSRICMERFVHLREDRWAQLSDNGLTFHLACQPFSDTSAIVGWQEFQQGVRLKHQCFQRMQHFRVLTLEGLSTTTLSADIRPTTPH